MQTISGVWRWRGNPLRRPTDVAEAWVCLLALLLTLVAMPVVGTVTGSAAQDSLRRSVREQRHTRHLVTATVLRTLAQAAPETDPDTGAARTSRTRVLAKWTAPDGTRRRGAVLADVKSPRAGEHFGLWTDPTGRITTRPLDSATARVHAVLAGFGAAVVVAGLIESVRRLVVWRMVRRRYTSWDRAWDRAGPDWGKAGTGS
ncbi:Rv1733c family protein [Streptomyces griseoluteus]|uniref:Rv1733c family protein n=1 Tax=Streptomyces griseoluteus TaxID=29306 RepID=UPI0036F6F4B5